MASGPVSPRAKNSIFEWVKMPGKSEGQSMNSFVSRHGRLRISPMVITGLCRREAAAIERRDKLRIKRSISLMSLRVHP